MNFNPPTLVSAALLAAGIAFGIPVLARGLKVRGSGVVYQKDFLLQRAPQLVSLTNLGLIIFSYLIYNGDITLPEPLGKVFCLAAGTGGAPDTALTATSWAGVAILLSGMIFMVGGWYSLGESFSTDAELLDGQKLREGGLLQFVMHPAYSGIIQSLLGGSIASLSPLSLLITVAAIAPLWLRRAKYEEELLIKTFGDEYKAYAQKVKWRRLIPSFIPIGV